MNLIVDIGNTRVKSAVFQGDDVVFVQTFLMKEWSEFFLKIRQSFASVDRVIVSNSGNLPEKNLQQLQKHYPVLLLSEKTKVPFVNAYATPATLGKDRIALAAAAATHYPAKPVLVIDAGTCVTYDFVNKGTYEGGAISPGLAMRFTAMHQFTDKLPLVSIAQEHQQKIALVGKTTQENLQIGGLSGLIFEIDGFIDAYLQHYEDLTVILTGGNSELLSKSLKNSIFAPNYFLLKGLNSILEFNTI